MSKINWDKKANELLKGKIIKECRYLTKEEANEMDWYNRPVAIIFTDGTFMFPMRDDEGNDGGAMAVGESEVLPVLSLNY